MMTALQAGPDAFRASVSVRSAYGQSMTIDSLPIVTVIRNPPFRYLVKEIKLVHLLHGHKIERSLVPPVVNPWRNRGSSESGRRFIVFWDIMIRASGDYPFFPESQGLRTGDEARIQSLPMLRWEVDKASVPAVAPLLDRRGRIEGLDPLGLRSAAQRDRHGEIQSRKS